MSRSDEPSGCLAAIGRFLELVQPGRRFVLTTHVHPDGDGLGSEAALFEVLAARGCEVRIVNADPVPPALSFLTDAARFETYDAARHDDAIEGADVVVMLDNSDPQRLGAMEAVVRRARGVRACIDHHPHPDPFWEVLVLRENASCTGALVHELVLAAGAETTPTMASALYAALVSDTGRFRFANATADAFRMAAAMVDAGARPADLFSLLDERASLGFLRLFGEVLAAMEVRGDGRVVVLRVPGEALSRLGAANEDTAEIINTALLHEPSRVAALFKELGPGRTKVSLRSKGSLDVNALARRHGGGGHRNASGIVLERAFDDAIATLVPELEALAAAEPPREKAPIRDGGV